MAATASDVAMDQSHTQATEATLSTAATAPSLTTESILQTWDQQHRAFFSRFDDSTAQLLQQSMQSIIDEAKRQMRPMQVCVVGRMGCGKSTLLNALSGGCVVPNLRASTAGLGSVSFCPVKITRKVRNDGRVLMAVRLPSREKLDALHGSFEAQAAEEPSAYLKETLQGIHIMRSGPSSRNYAFGADKDGLKQLHDVINLLCSSTLSECSFGVAAAHIESIELELDHAAFPSFLTPEICLVDLPGLFDTDKARTATAVNFFQEADYYVVLSEAKRPELMALSTLMEELSTRVDLLQSCCFVLTQLDAVENEYDREDEPEKYFAALEHASRKTSSSLLTDIAEHVRTKSTYAISSDERDSVADRIGDMCAQLPIQSAAAKAFLVCAGLYLKKDAALMNFPPQLMGIQPIAERLASTAEHWKNRPAMALSVRLDLLLKEAEQKLRSQALSEPTVPTLPVPDLSAALGHITDIRQRLVAMCNEFLKSVTNASAPLAADIEQWLTTTRVTYSVPGWYQTLETQLIVNQLGFCEPVLHSFRNRLKTIWTQFFRDLSELDTAMVQHMAASTPEDQHHSLSVLIARTFQQMQLQKKQGFSLAFDVVRAHLFDPRQPNIYIRPQVASGPGLVGRILSKLGKSLANIDLLRTSLLAAYHAMLGKIVGDFDQLTSELKLQLAVNAKLSLPGNKGAAQASTSKEDVQALIDTIERFALDLRGGRSVADLPCPPRVVVSEGELNLSAFNLSPSEIAAAASPPGNPFAGPVQTVLQLDTQGVPFLVHKMYQQYLLTEVDYMADGFYWVNWQSAPNGGLCTLELIKKWALCPSGAEVLVFDSSTDAELRNFTNLVIADLHMKKYIEKHCSREAITLIAQHIDRCLGSADSRQQFTLANELSMRLQTAQQHRVLPIGQFMQPPAHLALRAGGLGNCRHRSLLFKYIADRVRAADGTCLLPTRVVVGATSNGNHAWNIVLVQQWPQLVDLMSEPSSKIAMALSNRKCEDYMRGLPGQAAGGAGGGSLNGQTLPELSVDQLRWDTCVKPSAGAQGVVVKAAANAITLAVKVMIPPALSAVDLARIAAAFEIERNTLASIRHSNVVQVLAKSMVPSATLIAAFPQLSAQLPSSQQLPATIMTWIEGGVTLQNFVIQAGLKIHLPLLLRIGEQIALALDALHTAPSAVVHRDLAPDNIMLTYHGLRMFRVQLVDFGVARFLQRTGKLKTNTHFVGKGIYIAPELFNTGPGALANATKVDIYSLGMVLLFMATGGHVANAVSSTSLLNIAVQSRGLAALIERCIDISPHRRPSAWDVYRSLTDLQFEQMRIALRK